MKNSFLFLLKMLFAFAILLAVYGIAGMVRANVRNVGKSQYSVTNDPSFLIGGFILTWSVLRIASMFSDKLFRIFH